MSTLLSYIESKEFLIEAGLYDCEVKLERNEREKAFVYSWKFPSMKDIQKKYPYVFKLIQEIKAENKKNAKVFDLNDSLFDVADSFITLLKDAGFAVEVNWMDMKMKVWKAS